MFTINLKRVLFLPSVPHAWGTLDMIMGHTCPLNKKLGCMRWRSETKCRPGPTIKCRPFHPSNFLTKFINGSSCFVLQRYKDY